MKSSKLIEFYIGQGPDASGRMIDDILSWGYDQLEDVHDYIQWLFPLKEESAFNFYAPVVTITDIDIFRSNSKVREKLLLSFTKLLDFYGFELFVENEVPIIIKSNRFGQKSKNWLTRHNHNFLRITRILKSLVLLGCSNHAVAFLVALEDVYKSNSIVIGETSVGYWRSAIS